jgi:hypothetical protein
MRRFLTLFLCLLTVSGARSGLAVSGRIASQIGQAHEHGSAYSVAHPAADSSAEAPAADPAWSPPASVVLVPVTRGLAQHAARQHSSSLPALALHASEPAAARGQSAAARYARLPLLRRGYRATGPPMRVDMSPFTNSLALAA